MHKSLQEVIHLPAEELAGWSAFFKWRAEQAQ